MIQPLNPGDQYNLSCTGPANVPGVTPLYTSDPVQAMYDLFACGGGPFGDPNVGPFGQSFGDETTPLAQLDYWGSDFNGTPGILGQSGNYYTSTLGPNAFFSSQFHSLFAWRSMGNANTTLCKFRCAIPCRTGYSLI
jgi:hypothetical protein